MPNVYGLGPAGSSYIISLDDKNIYAYDRYVEKYGRPRSICAGGLGLPAIKEMIKYVPVVSNAINHSVKTYVDSVEYIGRDIKVFIEGKHLGLAPYAGVVVDRTEFDYYLFKEAMKKVDSSKPINDVNIYAIGFEGLLNINKKDLESLTQIWVETKDVDTTIRLVYIKNWLETGYYWEFPEYKNGIVKIGVGASLKELEKKNITITQLLQKFVEYRGVKGKIIKKAGSMLPLTKFKKEYMFRREGIYIGTAGGLVNPATGAGIRYAVLSGYAVAKNDYNLLNKLIKEVNRFYIVKKIVEMSSQKMIDKTIKMLAEETLSGGFDLEDIHGKKNFYKIIKVFLKNIFK